MRPRAHTKRIRTRGARPLRKWVIGGFVTVVVVAFIASGLLLSRKWLPGGPQASPGPRMSPSDQGGPQARGGPQLADPANQDIDVAHKATIDAFPAATQGKGGIRLPYREENGFKVFELETRPVRWEVEPGHFVDAYSYNGMVPGPEIRVKEGDRVRVIVRNNLPESTSVHWHGLDMIGNNRNDGVTFLTSAPIKPGQSYTYEFTASPPGTHMYHSHHDSTKQVGMGLLGPLIVEPLDKSKEPKVDQEAVMVLNDGQLGLTINGKSFPATEPITAKLGQRIRVRWMNEGAMIHPMHLHGPRMWVYARDGAPLPQPYLVDTITVAPGERWDTIIEARSLGKWAIHCHILPHAEGEHGMFGLVTALIVE